MDKTVQDAFQIDAIVTMVDAKHFQQHLDSEELQQQLAFADRLVLNKIDLVPEEAEQRDLIANLSAINPSAQVIKSKFGQVPLDEILDIRGFDLEKVLDREPEFLRNDEACGDSDCHDAAHNHVGAFNSAHVNLSRILNDRISTYRAINAMIFLSRP